MNSHITILTAEVISYLDIILEGSPYSDDHEYVSSTLENWEHDFGGYYITTETANRLATEYLNLKKQINDSRTKN